MYQLCTCIHHYLLNFHHPMAIGFRLPNGESMSKTSVGDLRSAFHTHVYGSFGLLWILGHRSIAIVDLVPGTAKMFCELPTSSNHQLVVPVHSPKSDPKPRAWFIAKVNSYPAREFLKPWRLDTFREAASYMPLLSITNAPEEFSRTIWCRLLLVKTMPLNSTNKALQW